MRLFLCGDLMTGRGIDQIMQSPSDPKIYEAYVRDAREYVRLAQTINGKIKIPVNSAYIWGDALKIWHDKNPTFRIGNLETALTVSEDYLSYKGINYRMAPKNAIVFKDAGFDSLSLANNHVLDWGAKGLEETLYTLDNMRIEHAGAGRNIQEAQKPAILTCDEGRVLHFSFCHSSSGVPYSWEAGELPGVFLLKDLGESGIDSVREVIGRYRREGDIVIASVHWGGNWGYEIPSSHQRFAKALIDLGGVHILHGHSSHHPRKFELYRGRPIFYGCGDFINDYEGISGHEEFRGNLCFMYFVDLETSPFHLRKVELVCMRMKGMRLERASLEEARWLFDHSVGQSQTLRRKIQFRKTGEIVVWGPSRAEELSLFP